MFASRPSNACNAQEEQSVPGLQLVHAAYAERPLSKHHAAGADPSFCGPPSACSSKWLRSESVSTVAHERSQILSHQASCMPTLHAEQHMLYSLYIRVYILA